jgi:succinyl-CoA synthetase alpha subunit
LKTYANAHDLMVRATAARPSSTASRRFNARPARSHRRRGASGTGTQEVTVRIHQLGSGVSQALGTGGHDLSKQIGGISMLYGLHALDADPATKVIVLVSKPPAPEIAARVLAAAQASVKPVVVIFLGADRVHHPQRGAWRSLLAGAADMACALAVRRPHRSPCPTTRAAVDGFTLRWPRASVT